MGKPPKRANLKPPGKCIFCGRGDLSKEHLWPVWTHKYLPKRPPNSAHGVWVFSHAKGNPRIKGLKELPRYRQGSVATIQARTVCRLHCNSGWMEGLETKVRPTLTPLLAGQPAVLDREAQRALAAWIALKVMVSESLTPENFATSQAERSFLMAQGEPPANWKIWIGHHQGEVWQAGRARVSTKLAVFENGKPGFTPDRDVPHNTQAVTVGIGQLLFQAISTALPEFDVELPARIARVMRKIWPYQGDFVWPPGIVLTEDDADFVAATMQRTFEDPAFPWFPGPDF